MTRTSQAMSGLSGSIEISEHAAWRQSVAISVLNLARSFALRAGELDEADAEAEECGECACERQGLQRMTRAE